GTGRGPRRQPCAPAVPSFIGTYGRSRSASRSLPAGGWGASWGRRKHTEAVSRTPIKCNDFAQSPRRIGSRLQGMRFEAFLWAGGREGGPLTMTKGGGEKASGTWPP